MIRRLVSVIGAGVLVATCLAACATVPSRASPSPSPSTPRRLATSSVTGPVASVSKVDDEQMVALVGTVGAMALVAAGPAGSLETVGGSAAPPDAAWLSGDGSTFVLTTLDGRILIGALAGLAAAPGDLGEPHPLRAFASLEPGSTADGRRLAFVDGDPGSGDTGRLTVTTLDGIEIRTVVLPRPAESPPAWLADGRIAVASRDRVDRPETLLVDPATGRISPLDTGPLRWIGTAANLVATVDTDGSAHAGPVAAWLTGATLPILTVDQAGGPALIVEPSPDGRELAIVLADANGGAASIRILASGNPWHEIARLKLPPWANRAIVSWQAVR